jgi:hypothetical protein
MCGIDVLARTTALLCGKRYIGRNLQVVKLAYLERLNVQLRTVIAVSLQITPESTHMIGWIRVGRCHYDSVVITIT